MPVASASTMILSPPRSRASWRMWPTSVMFLMCRTDMPWSSRTRRTQSAIIYERKLPMWASLYTVGPHVYMPTREGSTGWIVERPLLSVS